MPFAYFARLSARDKRVYLESDGIHAIRLPRAAALRPLVPRLEAALGAEDRGEIQRLCQELTDGINTRLSVPPCRIAIHAVRPADDHGELHGLYQPEDGGDPAHIALWMRTAQRRQVVAFKTFLRTLLHEICHHLDYELFKLAETFHTQGFYKRESSLFHQLVTAPE